MLEKGVRKAGPNARKFSGQPEHGEGKHLAWDLRSCLQKQELSVDLLGFSLSSLFFAALLP